MWVTFMELKILPVNPLLSLSQDVVVPRPLKPRTSLDLLLREILASEHPIRALVSEKSATLY